MTELIASFATGVLWLAAFALLVLHIRRGSAQPVAIAALAAYPLFFALQVVLAQILAAAGWLTTPGFLAVYVAAVAAGGGLYLLRSTRASGDRGIEPEEVRTADGHTLRLRRLALVTVAVVLGALTLFTLIAPVRIWDALAYHMPMIASYVQNGSLDTWPTQDLRQIYRVNAGELQMLNVALLSRSDAWVELPNLLALVMVLVATFELASMALRRPALAWLAVLLVLSAPQIVIGAATEKNDLVFTAVLLCAFYWVIRAATSHEHTGVYILLAALSAGIAAATKVMGLNVVGAVGLLALILSIRRRLALRHVVLFTAATTTALLLLAGSVYIRNLTRSAVPVGVAPGELYVAMGLSNLTRAAHFYIYDLTLRRLVTMPVFEHDFMHYGYLFPFILLFGVAGMVAQVRQRRMVQGSIALLTAALFVSIIAVRQPIGWDQRFMIWLVPVLAIAALSWAPRLPVRRQLSIAWLAAGLAAVNVGMTLTLEADRLFLRSARHVLSTGTLAGYLDVPNRRYISMNTGFDAFRARATPRDSILYAGTDDSWMYIAWGRRFTRHVEGVWDAEHAARQISSRRFRFVIVEAAAHPDMEGATRAHALDAHYDILAETGHRTIFVRQDSPGELIES
jgi:hypothetical protein